mmetsp:Transcript_12716/g.46950  ORF Transcript_12716/g.46950 Transcript_12716/m.46950 type:complete len:228 (-) Transcript_12716:165-848(-)
MHHLVLDLRSRRTPLCPSRASPLRHRLARRSTRAPRSARRRSPGSCLHTRLRPCTAGRCRCSRKSAALSAPVRSRSPLDKRSTGVESAVYSRAHVNTCLSGSALQFKQPRGAALTADHAGFGARRSTSRERVARAAAAGPAPPRGRLHFCRAGNVPTAWPGSAPRCSSQQVPAAERRQRAAQLAARSGGSWAHSSPQRCGGRCRSRWDRLGSRSRRRAAPDCAGRPG